MKVILEEYVHIMYNALYLDCTIQAIDVSSYLFGPSYNDNKT